MNLRTASTNHPVWNTANSPLLPVFPVLPVSPLSPVSAHKMEHEVRIGPGLTRAGGQDDGSFTNSLKLSNSEFWRSTEMCVSPYSAKIGDI